MQVGSSNITKPANPSATSHRVCPGKRAAATFGRSKVLSARFRFAFQVCLLFGAVFDSLTKILPNDPALTTTPCKTFSLRGFSWSTRSPFVAFGMTLLRLTQFVDTSQSK